MEFLLYLFLDLVQFLLLPTIIIVFIIKHKKNSNYKLDLESTYQTIIFPKEYKCKDYKKIIFGDKYLYVEDKKSKPKSLLVYQVKYTDILSEIKINNNSLKIKYFTNHLITLYKGFPIKTDEYELMFNFTFDYENENELKPFLENIEKIIKEKKYKQSAELFKLKTNFDTSEFKTKFKEDFKIDFDTLNKYSSDVENFNVTNALFDGSGPQHEVILRYFKNAKLVFIKHLNNNAYLNRDYEKIEKGIIIQNFSPEEKLILYSKEQLGDDFYSLVKEANYEKLKNMLIPLENITSLNFRKNIKTFGPSQRHSPLTLALQAEFISPMYAMANLLEDSSSTTYDNSAYEFVFYNNGNITVYMSPYLYNYRYQFINDIEKTLKDREIQQSQIQILQSLPPQQTKEEKLTELKNLLDKGIITQKEYDEAKTKIISE